MWKKYMCCVYIYVMDVKNTYLIVKWHNKQKKSRLLICTGNTNKKYNNIKINLLI